MKKQQISRNTIFDKLHRGIVYACIGVTLYGTAMLGLRIHRYLTVIRPERKLQELKMLEEGSHENPDKAPIIKD